jgi:hypothetical protein
VALHVDAPAVEGHTFRTQASALAFAGNTG